MATNNEKTQELWLENIKKKSKETFKLRMIALVSIIVFLRHGS